MMGMIEPVVHVELFFPHDKSDGGLSAGTLWRQSVHGPKSFSASTGFFIPFLQLNSKLKRQRVFPGSQGAGLTIVVFGPECATLVTARA